MNKKWTVRPQELWNPAAIEQWLEDEAAKGWQIHKYSGWFAVMKRMEPKVCRVRVQPHEPETTAAWEERVTAYEEMGWQFMGSVGRNLDTDYEVYCCDDPAVPELDTDPVVYGMAWEGQLKRALWSAWLLLLVALVAPVILALLWKGSVVELLLSLPMALLYALLVGCPLLAAVCIRQLFGVGRLRRRLAAGVGPTRDGRWKRDRLWWRVITWVFLGYWICYLSGAMLDVRRAVELENYEAFMVSETTLLPESRAEDWRVERFDYKSTALRPYRFLLQLCYTDQQRVRNHTEQIRFEFLAGLAYRERAEEFLADWPDAARTEVENPAFDEAVLLRGEEDVQMLLVRSGRTVYSLWVNFPADLAAQANAVAALIA